MTATEKRQAYGLLRAASDWLCGYAAPGFSEEAEFFDDPEPLPAGKNALGDGGAAHGFSGETAHSAGTDKTTAMPHDHGADGGLADSAEKNVTQRDTAAALEELAAKIAGCQNCILCQKRTNTVPGEGVLSPVVLVVGEGPGEEEDKTGRPFVGKAGQLLDKMLGAIHLDRQSNCYIANIVKCRPPFNRTPMPDEAAACSGFLQAQIHALRPKMILAMGRTAAQNLLGTTTGINALRGMFFDYNGIPLLATYHPSALLRDEALKRPAWDDLKLFRTRLQQEVPDYAGVFFRNQNRL